MVLSLPLLLLVFLPNLIHKLRDLLRATSISAPFIEIVGSQVIFSAQNEWGSSDVLLRRLQLCCVPEI